MGQEKNELDKLPYPSKPISTPPTSLMPSLIPTQLGFMPHTFLSSQAEGGLMMPPLSTNPLMLPGLMNIPPTALSLSPFGSSLESLARAAGERARNFGNFSPAHVPAGFSPAQVPAAFSPAHVPGTAPVPAAQSTVQ